MTPAPSIVCLVGLRCAGKSTVGRLLAERLGWPFVDLDEDGAFHFVLREERPASARVSQAPLVELPAELFGGTGVQAAFVTNG